MIPAVNIQKNRFYFPPSFPRVVDYFGAMLIEWWGIPSWGENCSVAVCSHAPSKHGLFARTAEIGDFRAETHFSELPDLQKNKTYTNPA